jgi:hypothetical protein
MTTESFRVYADKLFEKNYGLPLQQARPHQASAGGHRYSIHIGDVCYQALDGHIVPLFNVIEPDVHPDASIPPDFERLSLSDRIWTSICTDKQDIIKAEAQIYSGEARDWSIETGVAT